MGLCIDKSREIRTSDKEYYKWTQWIFIKLFNSWYDTEKNQARDIKDLILCFEKGGSFGINAAKDNNAADFSANDWTNFSELEKSEILMQYRLTYLSYATVNWCPKLGTVLANDEVINGVSERGGHPVEKRKMKQWMMRITAYADRLLSNLNSLDWPESLKETQKNWIGKSQGIVINFNIDNSSETIDIYTSKSETIFGVTFLCISPEHPSLQSFITNENKLKVNEYVEKTSKDSELERVSNLNQISGIFTGKYAINPANNQKIPIWIGNYVLSSYGTGVVMGVPSEDARDSELAKKYDLNFIDVLDKNTNKIINSNFLNGMSTYQANESICQYLCNLKIGKKKTNFKLRDAIFGRQRYWGEPIPIYYEDGIPKAIKESELPLELPEINNYLPTKDGTPPLGRAKEWLYKGKFKYELTTMPSWAASTWYFLRYMSPNNENHLVNSEDSSYWDQVDLYIGGSEHATGHLLYSRFWNLFLYDIGVISFAEPFKKIINQGMLQGRSSFIYRIKGENTFVSSELKNNYDVQKLHVDIKYINSDDSLNIKEFKTWRNENKDSKFIYDGKHFYCDWTIEKMSKSKYNVVNPDDIIQQFGSDVFRIYEMFLGPIQQSKPWMLNGIEGVSKFINKLWRLFYNDKGELIVSHNAATHHELHILHTMLQKVASDIDRFSYNTAISAMMICVNELTAIKCHSTHILKDLLIAVSPFAVYISQELWQQALKQNDYIVDQSYPEIKDQYLDIKVITYPITINGKLKLHMDFDSQDDNETIKQKTISEEKIKRLIKSQEIKKFIHVPGKIINIVI